jgi:hypothetical protein
MALRRASVTAPAFDGCHATALLWESARQRFVMHSRERSHILDAVPSCGVPESPGSTTPRTDSLHSLSKALRTGMRHQC